MASFKEKVASVAVEQAVKYARKDFKRNAPRILNLVEMQVFIRLWMTLITIG